MSAPRPARNPWAIALTVTLATFMEVLDTSIANVALPHIAGNLGAGEDESTWVLTSYLVANAIVLPLSAWLSRLFGRKRFYMTCVALFTVSSTLCGVAPSLGWLVIFRILQGGGGGGLQPSEQAILADTFPPERRGMAFAVYGIAVVSAPALGPTLGGWITDNYSWRWLFFMNVPVGIVSLLLTSVLVEDPPHEKRRGRGAVDVVGLGLIAVGLGALQVLLDRGERLDWLSSDLMVVMAALAAFGIVAAILWELGRRDPIVDLGLFRERNFATAFALMFALGFVLLGSTVLIPLFLQTEMGYTATIAGEALSFGAITVMLLMPLVGWLLSHVQASRVIAAGLFLAALGLWRMSGWTLDVDFRRVALDRILQASGIAFLFVPINTVAYRFVPKEKNNEASSLMNVARNVGGSIGISVVTTLLARRAQVHRTFLAGHLTPLDPAFTARIAALRMRLSGPGAAGGQPDPRALARIDQAVGLQATLLAALDIFRLEAFLFLAATLLVFLLKRYRPSPGAAPGH
jgi:DHA2 family multidrug resistance protein